MNKHRLREIERAGYRTSSDGGSYDPKDTVEVAQALNQAQTDKERDQIRDAFHAGYNRSQTRIINRAARRAGNFMKMIQDLDQ